jgi:hypothetical protein
VLTEALLIEIENKKGRMPEEMGSNCLREGERELSCPWTIRGQC